MAIDLDGAVALITGSANGIGDALLAILASDRTGEAWYVQASPPGRALRLPERSGTPRPRRFPDRRSPRDALTALDERGVPTSRRGGEVMRAARQQVARIRYLGAGGPV